MYIKIKRIKKRRFSFEINLFIPDLLINISTDKKIAKSKQSKLLKSAYVKGNNSIIIKKNTFLQIENICFVPFKF